MPRSVSTRLRQSLFTVLIVFLLWPIIPAIHSQDQPFTHTIKTLIGEPAPVVRQAAPLLAASHVIMQENFEGTWPTGKWSVINLNPINPIGWNKRYCPPHTGLYGETVALNPYGGGAGCLTHHPNNASVIAVYGPFDLSVSTDAIMTFYLYGRTSTAMDGDNNPLDSLFVGSSIDGQNFAGVAYFGDHTNGPEANDYWKETLDLSDELGHPQVWIAFWFESDANGTDLGFTIDDVEISASVGVPTASPTPTFAPSRTPTLTVSPTPRFTPSATPTARFIPSPTPTFGPSRTPTLTVSPTPTLTPSATPTAQSAPPPTLPARIYLPAIINPAARRILSLHHRLNSGYSITTMNPDGSDERPVVSCQPEGMAGMNIQSCGQSWSPDRSQIAFHSKLAGDASLHLYVVNADGSNLHRLTNDDLAQDGFPTWSADGRQIAFVRHTAGDWVLTASIYTINVDGTNLTRVTGGSLFSPIDWSPDGQRIAYSCVIPSRVNTGLCTIGNTGQDQLIVADDVTTTEMAPAWSPDGSRIAYVNAPNGATTDHPEVRIVLNMGDLHIVHADGTNNEILVTGVAESRGGAWSPDGQLIVFARRYGQPALAREPADLYLIKVSGDHASTRLTDNANQDRAFMLFNIDPDW